MNLPGQIVAPPEPDYSRFPAAIEPCPKCGKNLIDPAGLGWCSGCGYCKSLADDAPVLKEKKPAPLTDVVQAGESLTVPMWIWASGIFLTLGFLFSLYVNKHVPEGDNLQRATWATVQIGVGLLVILVAQFFATFMLAPDDPTMSGKDALFPFRLWPMAIKRMPRFKECLWAALLGVSLIAGSIAFVGGFNHWFSYLPSSAAAREKEKADASPTRGEPLVIPTD